MPIHESYIVLGFIAVFVAGFAWSWGPLGWLISSEVYPIESRNAGYFFAVSTNMLCTFIIAQLFLTMLCAMRSMIFFFFVAWLVVMCAYICFLMPETKKIPVDEMEDRVWKKHWFWKRFFSGDRAGAGAGDPPVVELPSASGGGGVPPVVERAEISQEIKEDKSV